MLIEHYCAITQFYSFGLFTTNIFQIRHPFFTMLYHIVMCTFNIHHNFVKWILKTFWADEISENICNCEILMSNAPLEMSFNIRVHYVKMSWLSYLRVGCWIWMSFFVATTLKIDCSLFKSLSKWNLFEFAIHLQIHILVIIIIIIIIKRFHFMESFIMFVKSGLSFLLLLLLLFFRTFSVVLSVLQDIIHFHYSNFTQL